MNWLIAYAGVVTLVMAWALVELKAERASSRMVNEFREHDRTFYRGWENIWFKQLERTIETPATKPKPASRPRVKKRST